MIKNVYAVRDVKVGAYRSPHISEADGKAARDFGAAVRDPASHFFNYPEDFELWKIAEYQDETGQYTNTEHQLIEQAVNVKIRLQRETGITNEN